MESESSRTILSFTFDEFKFKPIHFYLIPGVRKFLHKYGVNVTDVGRKLMCTDVVVVSIYLSQHKHTKLAHATEE